MSIKNHPILTTFVILGVLALLLGVTAAIAVMLFAPSSALPFSDKIGVIPINGTISDSVEITSQLVKFRKDRGIKAIILRIDSPGGGVGPTQEIYQEVRRIAQTKKVVASLGGVAASGGYYIAVGANKIVANPGTITGSIGAFMQFVRLEDLFSKLGINFEVLKSGEFKDIGSPHRKMTERDRSLINALLADIQSQFVEEVARGRTLSVEKVLEIADGRIFSGARAKELGLVDILGNFQDAVELVKEMAGIKGDPTLVYPKKSRQGLWDMLFESCLRTVVKASREMRPQLDYRWSGLLKN